MFIWPFSISVEYDWKLVHHFFSIDCILPLLLLIIIAAMVVYMIKKDKTSLIVFAALWITIALAPRSTIIPSSELLADYKTYSASFGILLLLAFGIVKIITLLYMHIPGINRRISSSLASHSCIALVILLSGYLTYNRNKVWRSSEEFWANIVENAPGKARAYNNLGVAISEHGRMQESIPLYKKAISMDHFYPDPWNNLAVAYSLTNKLDLAINTLKQAIRIHRDYPEGYNNLASFLIIKKEYALAERMLECAINLRPYYGKAYFNYGKLYLEQGNTEKAFEAFKAACTKADYDNEIGFSVYAKVSVDAKKYDDAIFAFIKLLELQPHSIHYALSLADAYFLNNQFFDAIPVLKSVINKEPQQIQAWYNLAECYFNTSQPEEAFQCFLTIKKYNPTIFPALDLRIAACLQFMGNSHQACMVLQQLIAQTSDPDIKETALMALNEVKKESNTIVL